MTTLRFLLLACALCATAARADLVWETKRQRVTGEPDSKQIRATFSFRNEGPTPVRILGVGTSCYCTSATPSIENVPPGASGTIDALFDVGPRTGLRAYRIFVRTEGEAVKGHELILEAEVPSAIKLTPRTLVWPEADRKSPQQVNITLPAGMVIREAEVSSPLFTAKVDPGIEPNQYVLTVTPRDVPAQTRGRVVLRTEPPTRNTMSVTVLLSVR